MKNILIITLLFITSISFAQDENYENIFFHNDTMKKYSKNSYAKTIKEFIKSEFATKSTTNDSLKNQNNHEVKICLIIDKEGSVKIYENGSQNKIIDDFVINSIYKLPKAKAFVDDKGKTDWFAMTMVFKLDISFVKPEVKSEISEDKKFELLEKTPVFKGCNSNLMNEKSKECFTEKMYNHIKKYFIYPTYAKDKNIQGRTTIYFIIEKDGTIQDKTVIGGHPVLQKSTLTIIDSLPIFTPGEINGEKVRVSYAQPIMYKLQ